MPTYHEITTTDLSALTMAADRWDGMAKEFHKQEVAYQRDVASISMGPAWIGLSAEAAAGRFAVTLQEFRNAQVEAKAVASLLREAHTRFVNLRKELESGRADAVKAGMAVSDQGVVSYDTTRLSEGERMALHHDPDYEQSVRTSVTSWQTYIDQLVKDVGVADADVQTALTAVVIDTDISDGTLGGFNGHAQSDIDKYTSQDTHTRTDGWKSEGKTSATGPGAGFSVTTDPKYGKEGSVKAYADLFHLTAQGTLTKENWKLAGIADGYGGARATANYGFNNKGVVGKAEASAGLRALAEGRAEYGPYAGAYGRAEGFAGAEAGVNVKATKEELTVGAKAFAGAKGTVAGGGEIAGIGIGGTAEGWAGPGAEAWWGLKKDDSGKFHLGGKAGVSPILGGAVGVEITVDPHKVEKTVSDAADAIGDGFNSAKNSLSHLF
ncbi:hypothetical protein ACF061_08190 [Streptomyces sp. NPDC015220]|uniref:hypothetical protein n=1 Tax=Streptomyces sp. NPDC015220 TaxID=3364947 RepID=UPI0036FCEC97